MTPSDRPSILQSVAELLPRQVTTDQVLQAMVDRGVAGHVAETGESVILEDVTSDEHFFAGIDRVTGFREHLSLPAGPGGLPAAAGAKRAEAKEQAFGGVEPSRAIAKSA